MFDMKEVAFIFPGQGSQWVGMGLDLYSSFATAKSVFDQADDVLDFPLSRMCFEGPEEELRKTINAQPALVTTSLACLQAMREISDDKLPQPVCTAGHSLGEYTALALAGVFDFATAIHLSRERGRLMHQAGQTQPGGMAAIIGMDEAPLAEVCQQTGTVIANINCPGQIVISGPQNNLTQAMELARVKGALRAIPLPVSGAFHTSLMQPAVDGMSEILDALDFHEPAIPVIANTSAQPLNSTDGVKAELRQQLCHCVRWQQSIEYMVATGVSTFVEIGPGKVLTGLIKRINKEVKTMNINDNETIRSLA